jgi:hypothetical protein
MRRADRGPSRRAVGLAVLLGLLGCPAVAAPPDRLAPYRWKARLVLALASGAGDPRLSEQRRIFAAMGQGAAERDLVLVEALGAEAELYRRRLGAGPEDFALLIGKDGGLKLAAPTPLGPEALFPTIDAMPMRRQEMKHAP